MPQVTDTQVLVVGLGVAGASVAHALASRGIAAIALEAQAPGHTRGSSHGRSRITRTAVGEGLAYLPLVRRSDEIWDALEARGHDLRRRTGLLYIARSGANAGLHGAGDFITATRRVGEAAGAALEQLDAAALRERFPQFLVPDDSQALFEPGGGVLRPEACVTALCAEAGRLGAVLRYNEPMLALGNAGGKVVVDTAAGRYRAERAILAIGGWTPGAVGGDFARDMRVFRQVQYWFETTREDLWERIDAPAFLWFHGPGSDDIFYGFPILAGDNRAVKAATEHYAVAGDPDRIDRTVTRAETDAMHATHVRGRLAGVTDNCVEALACLYTHNVNPAHPGRFLIGAHPGVDGVTVISACSGHGFKHAPGVADAVVRRLFDEPAFCALALFA